MTEALAESPEWDIALACDLSCRDVIEKFPGGVIEIDPLAISSILEYFDTDSAGRLLFIATNEERVEHGKMNTPTETCKEGFILGATTTTLDPFHVSRNEKPFALVRVAIGGGEYAKQQSKLEGRDDSSNLVGPLTLQEASVHELRHASDLISKEFKKKRGRMSIQNLGTLAVMGITAASGAAAALKSIDAPLWLVGLGAVSSEAIAMAVSATKIIPKYAGHRLLRSSFARMMEDRAYATESIAQQLPQVITILDNLSILH